LRVIWSYSRVKPGRFFLTTIMVIMMILILLVRLVSRKNTGTGRRTGFLSCRTSCRTILRSCVARMDAVERLTLRENDRIELQRPLWTQSRPSVGQARADARWRVARSSWPRYQNSLKPQGGEPKCDRNWNEKEPDSMLKVRDVLA